MVFSGGSPYLSETWVGFPIPEILPRLYLYFIGTPTISGRVFTNEAQGWAPVPMSEHPLRPPTRAPSLSLIDYGLTVAVTKRELSAPVDGLTVSSERFPFVQRVLPRPV
jgi:hypothetical protein